MFPFDEAINYVYILSYFIFIIVDTTYISYDVIMISLLVKIAIYYVSSNKADETY